MTNANLSEPIPSDFVAYLRFGKRLASVLGWYLLASVPLLAGYLGALHNVGECLSSHRLARLSRGVPVLWSSGYYHNGILRPGIAAELQPQVAVIGSSRVMQFRRPMFAKAESFYVAGMSGNFSLSCLTTLKRLLRQANKPELVILGLDFWWFETPEPPQRQTAARLTRWIDHGRYRRWREHYYQAREWGTFTLDQLQLLQQAWRDPRLYSALAAGGAHEPESGRELQSVNSRLTGDGYRNDGSYRYTQRLENFARTGKSDGTDGADWRRCGYTGNHLSPAALEDLDEFVAACRQNDIRLIVFLPPLYGPALDFLRQRPESAQFWRNFPAAIAQTCAGASVPFHDFSDASPLCTRGGNYFDWFHSSEKLSGRLLLAMCDAPDSWELLAPYVDREALDQEVHAAGDRFLVYGD